MYANNSNIFNSNCEEIGIHTYFRSISFKEKPKINNFILAKNLIIYAGTIDNDWRWYKIEEFKNCAILFFLSDRQEAYLGVLEIIFKNINPASLCKNLKIICCYYEHTLDCLSKWKNLKFFLGINFQWN